MAADRGKNDKRVSDFVNEERLWRFHMEMAKIGATALGGNNRQALSPEDADARTLFVKWARERNFEVSMDEIGNVFVRRPGTDPKAPPVLSGSHLDTQPTGGRFDGIYGCLGALEVLHAVEDSGIQTKRSIEACVWTNEEGTRFSPGCLGSDAFAHPKNLRKFLAIKDKEGVTVGDALADTKKRMPKVDPRPLGFPLHAFVEAHIEQGPILEAKQKTIGVVTGIQGARRYTVTVTGENAHSGTTPRSRRKDSFFAAVDMVNALKPMFTENDPDDILRFTIGRFEVHPGSLYVVPGQVIFGIDVRHPSTETLEGLGSQIEGICKKHAGPCTVEVKEIVRVTPTPFVGMVPEIFDKATKELGYPYMRILSGAGHDSQNVAPLCPTGMIFVPCEGGRSHNEIENATPGDLAAGARVLAEAMVEMANQ